MYYQTYRPQKFKDLIGNDTIVASITGAMKNNKLPHAFFFHGGRGSGKTTTARLLAKLINCQNPVVKEISKTNKHIHLEPCEKCTSCKSVKEGNYLDLIEIDAASNRGIDNIRDLKETVNLSPSMGKSKVYIIDEVHMLTKEASNALLKTLEEPPTHAYFVLCTTNPEKVLTTVKSRCIQHQFGRPSIDDIVKKLKKISKKESLSVSDEELKSIAIRAKGAYREAETILEQLSSGGREMVNMKRNFELNDLIYLLSTKDAKGSIEYISDIYSSGFDMNVWLENFIEYLRALLLLKIGIKTELEVEDVSVSLGEVKLMIDIFSKSVSNMMHASIQILPIEMAIVEYCGLGNVIDPDSSFNEEGKEVKKVIKKNAESKKKKPEDNINKKENVAKEEKEIKSVEKKIVKKFPYKQLINHLKPQNHSIYLVMSSCKLVDFDGKNLNIEADFTFHKERLMSNKVRGIIESVASELIGDCVVLNCDVAKKGSGNRLTDKNVVKPISKVDLEEVFESVFGEDVQ